MCAVGADDTMMIGVRLGCFGSTGFTAAKMYKTLGLYNRVKDARLELLDGFRALAESAGLGAGLGAGAGVGAGAGAANVPRVSMPSSSASVVCHGAVTKSIKRRTCALQLCLPQLLLVGSFVHIVSHCSLLALRHLLLRIDLLLHGLWMMTVRRHQCAQTNAPLSVEWL